MRNFHGPDSPSISYRVRTNYRPSGSIVIALCAHLTVYESHKRGHDMTAGGICILRYYRTNAIDVACARATFGASSPIHATSPYRGLYDRHLREVFTSCLRGTRYGGGFLPWHRRRYIIPRIGNGIPREFIIPSFSIFEGTHGKSSLHLCTAAQ